MNWVSIISVLIGEWNINIILPSNSSFNKHYSARLIKLTWFRMINIKTCRELSPNSSKERTPLFLLSCGKLEAINLVTMSFLHL
jgi:hypothetical protein